MKEMMPKGSNGLSTIDTTPEGIQKKIRKIALEHPLTLLPTAVGVGLASCGIITGISILLYLSPLGLLGPLFYVYRAVFAKDRLEMTIRRGYRMLAEEEGRREVELLKGKLRDVGEVRGADQLAEIQRAMHRFQEKLDEDVGQNRPEYEQFLQSAHLTYLAAVKSLKMVVSNALDAQVINLDECRRRIKGLQKDPEKNKTELTLLNRKVTCLDQTEKDSDELLQAVEGAITTIMENTRDLSNIAESKQTMAAALKKFQNVADINREIRERVNKTWEQLDSSF